MRRSKAIVAFERATRESEAYVGGIGPLSPAHWAGERTGEGAASSAGLGTTRAAAKEHLEAGRVLVRLLA